jgi:hypothetical protein
MFELQTPETKIRIFVRPCFIFDRMKFLNFNYQDHGPYACALGWVEKEVFSQIQTAMPYAILIKYGPF